MRFVSWVEPRWVGAIGAALIAAALLLRVTAVLDTGTTIAALVIGAAVLLLGAQPHDVSRISVGRGMFDVETRKQLASVLYENAEEIVREQYAAMVAAAQEEARQAQTEWERDHPGEVPGPEHQVTGGPGIPEGKGAVVPDLDDYLEMAERARTPRELATVLVQIVKDAEHRFGSSG